MTSPATHDETIAFLDRHDRFGLPAEDLRIFCQGTMPAVDADTGKLLLAEPGSLFLSPDGHGGMLAALDASGCLTDCRQRGVDVLFYQQVDNPMVSMCDPEFVGYHLLAGSELSSQVVAKRHPYEKVGVVASINGQLRTIEYSDLPADQAERANPDGSLFHWAGSIAVHVFNVAFLERVAGNQKALPFHRARKKVPYVDQSGERIEPDAPNAFKFERFIFDLLPSAARPTVVEIDPAEGFAPVKNAHGEAETPETARAAMVRQHARWLRAAGATVDEGVTVEINPLFALDAEELATKIEADLHVTQSTYFV
jgi:UDP-N-acetylglucosamine/UDP-N-acetylgalactosamine diphosphorylase